MGGRLKWRGMGSDKKMGEVFSCSWILEERVRGTSEDLARKRVRAWK